MKNWILQRYKLLRKIKKRIVDNYGEESSLIHDYSSHFKAYLQTSRPRSIVESQLIERLSKINHAVLLGTDFHSYLQNQKAHLRILRQLSRPLVLALECFRSADQAILDSYIKGDLSEEIFLKQIRWRESWGFPWENYKALIQLAREKKWKVVGINSSGVGSTSKRLLKRDQWMAKQIHKQSEMHSKSLVYAIVGELHAAPRYLPRQIELINSNIEILVLFVNPDPLLEKMRYIPATSHSKFYQLDRQNFAVINSSSLAKWQSYLLFLEAQELNLNDDFGFVDFSDHVFDLQKTLLNFIVSKKTPRCLSVYSHSSEIPKEVWKQTSSAVKREIKVAEVYREVSFGPTYGISSSINFNHLCELAAYSILPEVKSDSSPTLLQRIWIRSWTYFYSKALNPHRKSRGLEELIHSKKVAYSTKLKLLAFSMSLRLNSQIYDLRRFQNQLARLKLSAEEEFLISLIMGELYGSRIYSWVSEEGIPLSYCVDLSMQNIYDSQFEIIFFNFVAELVESVAPQGVLKVVV